ncbi:MAG: hypothetical protein JW966_13180 [Anaerolineae bacterium]|nr:hypothetical protein [Anaerolineae bacterium]
MGKTLFVANLPPDATEQQLTDLFETYGDVIAVHLDTKRISGVCAIVEMASEKSATKANNALNGHDLDGSRLTISPPDVVIHDQTAKQRKVAQQLCEQLGETDKVPVRQIDAIIRLCGTSFAQVVLDEARALDAAGGMLTQDGARPRTLGGIFFFIARHRMAPPIHRIVFNRKGRIPGE